MLAKYITFYTLSVFCHLMILSFNEGQRFESMQLCYMRNLRSYFYILFLC